MGMLPRYQTYMLSHLAWPTVAITFSLTGIVWLTQMLRFVDFMINRGLTLSDFLYLTGLMLPSLLLILLPISLCIATIYTYQKLQNESELIVMSSAGISPWQIARPALLMGGIVMVICYILALYLMPLSNQKFRDIRLFFRDQYASILLEEEVFNTPVAGLTVFVRERNRNGDLHGILLHDARNPAAAITMTAQEGRLENTPTGPRFFLKSGLRQERSGAHMEKLSWLSFDEYAIDIGFYATKTMRQPEPDERGVGELFSQATSDPAKAPMLLAEAHQRLIWPMFGLALPLLAVALLQASEFNRRGQLKRIVFTVICAAIFILLFFALRSAVVKQPFMMPLLYLLLAGVFALSSYLLIFARTLPEYVHSPIKHLMLLFKQAEPSS